MELYLKIEWANILLKGTRFENVIFQDPTDLIACYSKIESECMQVTYSYAIINDFDHFFLKLDRLQELFPPFQHSYYWGWGGLRKDDKYYIYIRLTSVDHIDGLDLFMKAIGKSFAVKPTNIPCFDEPVLNAPFVIEIENDEIDGKYIDSDQLLREYDEKCKETEGIQWERGYSEPNGGIGLDIWGFTLTALGFLIDNIDRFEQYLHRKQHIEKLEHLRKIVEADCEYLGSIEYNLSDDKRIHNAELGKYMYEFTQIMRSGKRRTIHISLDGKHIIKYPFD